MSTFARIQNNLVLDVIDFDPVGRFHQDLANLYQVVPDYVKPNATYIDGVWSNPPEPAPLTPEQIAINEAAIVAAALEQLADAVRSERNVLLAKTDWTQTADAPVDKAAWAAYRQALRDLPQQAGFPTTISWPVKPE